MTVRSVTLTLPSDLLTQLQQFIADNPEALHRFVVRAIDHELQRC